MNIYARLNLYIGLDKRKSILPYYFLFLSYGLNTEFEHRSMNTEGCHWRLKRVGAELCSDLCSRQKKKQLRFVSQLLDFQEVVPLGLEPRTPWLWVRCSNQLSYGTGNGIAYSPIATAKLNVSFEMCKLFEFFCNVIFAMQYSAVFAMQYSCDLLLATIAVNLRCVRRKFYCVFIFWRR